MRYSFRLFATLVALVPTPVSLAFLTGSWSIMIAQLATQPVGAAMPDEPAAKQAQAVEEVLQSWESASSKIKSLEGMHVRKVYDLAREVETVGSGEIFFSLPDHGRIDRVGVSPELQRQSSARIGSGGKPFQQVADGGEKWICSGKEIVVTDEAAKTFQVIPMPNEAQGNISIYNPLPFVFGMKAAQAKQRFQIFVGRNTKDAVNLTVKPRLESDQKKYTKAHIILDKPSYLPAFVKLFDPSGKLETVYTFESWKINRRIAPNSSFSGIKDLEEQGYNRIVP